MSVLIFVLMLLGSLCTFAQNRVGNGGNVAVCTGSGGVRKIQLLDFYEDKGFDFDLSAFKALGSKEQILQNRLKRLQELAPKLALQYTRRLAQIESEWSLKSDLKLVSVPDSLHAFEPGAKDCSIKQIIIRLGELKEGKRFLVDDNLWGKLTEPQKAGLLMHEMIYEHLFKLGDNDSRKARQIVALVFSKRFDDMTVGDFWLFIKGLQIPIYP